MVPPPSPVPTKVSLGILNSNTDIPIIPKDSPTMNPAVAPTIAPFPILMVFSLSCPFIPPTKAPKPAQATPKGMAFFP